MANQDRLATDEPRTHVLIEVNNWSSTLPIPVDAKIVRKNLLENPNDHTRPGEVRTISPESFPEVNP